MRLQSKNQQVTDRQTARFAYLYWGLQLFGWGLYAVANALLIGYSSSRRLWQYPYLNLGLMILIGVIVTQVMRHVYRGVRRRKSGVLRTAGIVVVGSPIFAIIWFFTLYGASRGLGINNSEYEVTLAMYFVSIFNMTFILLLWSALYFGIKYWKDLQVETQQGLVVNALAHQAQVKMLRYQINPHFLFNALNSTRALIDEDAERAKQMITLLSGFLRFSLQPGGNEIELGEEVAAIQQYLDIEKTRFEDKLQVKIEIPVALSGALLPPMLIHPLVENAIKYGMQTSKMPLRIQITVHQEAGSLLIAVENSGMWIDSRGKKSVDGTGIGLENVRQRLSVQYGDQAALNSEARAGSVVVGIRIPLRFNGGTASTT